MKEFFSVKQIDFENNQYISESYNADSDNLKFDSAEIENGKIFYIGSDVNAPKNDYVTPKSVNNDILNDTVISTIKNNHKKNATGKKYFCFSIISLSILLHTSMFWMW